MPSQRALIIVASFAASLALTLGVILWFASGSPRPSVLAPAPIGGAFELVDHNGGKVTEQALSGKPTIIFFGFTR